MCFSPFGYFHTLVCVCVGMCVEVLVSAILTADFTCLKTQSVGDYYDEMNKIDNNNHSVLAPSCV